MSFLLRRARAQWPLLAALLAVVTVGITLLGVCTLLITRTGERAVESAAARAPKEGTDVAAYTSDVAGPDARSVVTDAGEVLTTALEPFHAPLSTRASTILRPLPSVPKSGDFPSQGYLSSISDLPERVEVLDGRLPAGGYETALFSNTAGLLGLRIGDRVPFGVETTASRPAGFEVTVVGIVTPRPGTGWDRDPLDGSGFNAAYNDGRFARPRAAYGPFLVVLEDVLASGSSLDRLDVTASPDLSAADHRALAAVEDRVRAADRRLGGVLGARVEAERIATNLPRTLAAASAQQRVTTATVAAVAILGSVLTATALALAARLTAGVRTVETGLLTALGFSRRQLAGVAATEALLLATAAAAIGIPASSALHAAITHLPALRDAGLAETFAVTGLQVLTVAAAALLLGAVLVTLALRPVSEVKERRSRGELIARSGTDVLLVVFAGAGLWQLWSQPAEAGGQDAVRILAPALLLLAGAALALRLVPPALAVADRIARGARGLVIPLAAFEAARRPQAVAAGLLVGLACAAGTFGVGYEATWQRSQHDQAALAVGTDLTITLATLTEPGQGQAVRAATGGTVSPATDRPVSIGQWLGTGGDAPRLVAIDTTSAGGLLRGRLDDGRTWTEVGAGLAPADRVTGLPVPAGAALSVRGTSSSPTPLTVAPQLVLQDRVGKRIPCVADPIPLDGAAHPLPGCVTEAGLELVAVTMPLVPQWESIFDAAYGLGGAADESDVEVTLSLPGMTGTPTTGWSAGSVGPVPEMLTEPQLSLGDGTLTMRTRARLIGPPEAALTMAASGFAWPGAVPVVVSERLADELGIAPGTTLSVTVGTTPVTVRVQDVVPTVPSAPGAGALLADVDWLSRALIVHGDVQPPIDAWWAGSPEPGAAARAEALHLGSVFTRDGEERRLAGGPLRAGLPATLRLLVPAAALLLLAGVVLHVTCDLQVRALEVARLRGLGMTRREIRRVLLGQHAGVLTPLVLAGALVGALATVLVVPSLVRSDTGAAPVPAVLPQWPWLAETGLIAALLAACLASVAVVVAVQARRADAAHLRVSS